MLTIQDVAEMLKVTTMTVRRWWYAGRMPAPIKIHGSIRWRDRDIIEWINGGCPKEKEQAPKQGSESHERVSN